MIRNLRPFSTFLTLAMVLGAGFAIGRLSSRFNSNEVAHSSTVQLDAKSFDNATGTLVPARIEGTSHTAYDFVASDNDGQTFQFYMGFTR